MELKTKEIKDLLAVIHDYALAAGKQTRSESIRNKLATIVLITEEVDIGLLAQRKFADGWDAAVLKLSEQTPTLEVELNSASKITNEHAGG